MKGERVNQGINDAAFDILVLMADEALRMLLEIRTKMKEDSECPFVKHLTIPTEITPFFARELSDSTGWTMVFKKRTLG